MPTGRRSVETTRTGPQLPTLNSVVDHRSVFVKLAVFGENIEAVCDSGTKQKTAKRWNDHQQRGSLDGNQKRHKTGGKQKRALS